MSGANMSLMDWVQDIDRSKYNIYFVLPKRNKIIEDKIKSLGDKIIIGNYVVSVKHLYKQPLIYTLKSLLKNIYNKVINPLAMLRVVSKLKKIKPDIIHSNSFATIFGVKIAIKLNIPHIWHIREFMEEDHQITHFNKKKVDKYCEYSNAIFISDVIKEKYISKFNKKSILLYDKINYNIENIKERKLFSDNEYNIAIIGILSENKGQLEAIKAHEILIKKNINAILNIVGIGPNEAFLKKYVNENKIKNVKFLGYQPNIVKIRNNMDIALVCSKNEALGRVTIEAMYNKNLVIGANAGCTKYLVKDNITGLLYQSDNEEDLANKIIYAINNQDKVELILEKAYKYAIDNFYDINYVEEIYKLYEGV